MYKRQPQESEIFAKYPKILKDKRAIEMICDTIRSMIMNFDNVHQVEELLEKQLDSLIEEKLHGSHALQNMADALPALGIVAAVLGVIKTMASIDKPPEILGGPMLAVAVVGLAVNLVSMKMLHAGSRESLNLKGAYFEVLADMLGSVGVILAAAVVLLTGWTLADPIIGAGIGLFIVPRTWILLKGAVHILMEGTPPEVDVGLLERQLMDLPGVTAVHDLHVWTLTSGLDALSCHLVVEDMARGRQALLAAQQTMEKSFGITHCTIQIEDADLRMDESDAH